MSITETPAAARLSPRLRRLLISLLPANLAIFLIYGATTGVLLQAQVQQIDPENKEGSYALIAGVGAMLALVAQPIAGVVSDRTRSRFGRRAPWLVGGSIVAAIALIGIGSANTILQVFLAWCATQIAMNFTQGPLSAMVPDQVPKKRLGLFSSIVGLGLTVGMLGGQVFASVLVPNFLLAYLILAGVLVLGLVAFVLFNPQASNIDEPREPFHFAAFLKTFWVNPVAHPSFFWAFSGRLLINAGYGLVSTYQLFILQDYIGLSSAEALALIPVTGVISVAGVLLTTTIAGPLSDRLGRRRIFVFICAVLLSIAMLIPVLWPTVGGILAFAAVGGLAFGIFHSVDTALINEVLPNKDAYAKDLGVINIAATLPQSIAPLAAAFIVLNLGGYPALFPWAVTLTLLGGFSVWMIRTVR